MCVCVEVVQDFSLNNSLKINSKLYNISLQLGVSGKNVLQVLYNMATFHKLSRGGTKQEGLKQMCQ